ncbi:Gfo/Idh/MocA family oxidoreductase [Vagococcus coleopterorum]|uniref:Gfo/Idh/MocA family oxidoreductase n=1 Tax=Vagococcus coleopterorum TaxID=2714946 RepID=A0A6G8APV4_9ENTE|nr:Gfo/Idh/MocA family oxidoreductase [Vagococcus coleopterorum]QIL46965.1 Gfo/Idh/MocA family oxidoreductase [Vagococcus coleopterorum]
MLKLGIIGTNWITKQFVEAAEETKRYQLTRVYSRREETAKEFGADFGVTTVSTDLNEFMTSGDVDVIYIASPNSLHFEQSKAALLAGKHVIVEKPAVTKLTEWQELVALAKEQKLFIFEAARNIHEDSFRKVTELLPDASELLGANLNFMKYSSRYDLVLAGEEPNIFSPKFAGGALMDLGVYVMYAAIAWFGRPTSYHYFAQKITTGVDGKGTIILRYPNFDVTMQTGKIANSDLPSEIYTQKETIHLDAVNSIETINVLDLKTQELRNVPATRLENPMVEEATDFADVIENPTSEALQTSYNDWLEIGAIVHELMEQMRQEAGIKFPTDSF